VLNLSKDEGEISPYEAKASDAIASFLSLSFILMSFLGNHQGQWTRQRLETTIIKEPTVPDIEWHGRLLAIVSLVSYAVTAISYT
jgi:hypothetical protein